MKKLTGRTKVLLAALAVAVLAGGACSEYNDERGRGDSPIGTRDDTPAELIFMPDNFSNVATKCDGHGHRLFVTTREAPVTVIDDAGCATK